MGVLQGDCREVLKSLGAASVDLAYLDPPFFTQKTHSLSTRDNSAEYSFEDRWASLDDYLAFMREVLQACHRVLKETGSIFLHCDRSAAHHLRLLLDQVFGADNFQSEIIWAYRRWSSAKKGLLNVHQTIYFYSKTDDYKFKTLYTDYSPTTNVDQILQARVRNELGKATYRRDESGDVVIGKEKRGVPLADVWNIPFLNPKAKERVGYPTQKPILLMERIIAIATDAGDCVLDPFCGSGTTLVAAKLLGRSYIGIDSSLDAVRLAEERLRQPIRSESQLLTDGEEGFLEKSDAERRILRALDAVPVERNSGIDGFLRHYVDGRPVAVRIQKADENIETVKRKLIAASKTKQCAFMILVRTTQNEGHALFDWMDENLLVIDSYDVVIAEWLEGHGQINHSIAGVASAQEKPGNIPKSRKSLRRALADLGPGPSAEEIDDIQREIWSAFK
ncbi:MAG: site-specific DNA-methyltransferase [Chloroflexi bacterium]|nr:site-specific DNA-methyltransferase [Chloroflexota bacterium]